MINQTSSIMNPMVKNIVAILVGIIVGIVVNYSIILLSGYIIPPPEGVDPSDPESIKANIHLYEARHFIFPFLAHASGTLVGAMITIKLAANRHLLMALVIGAFFLIGGIMMVVQLPSPTWFNALDLVCAYMPVAWLAWRITKK